MSVEQLSVVCVLNGILKMFTCVCAMRSIHRTAINAVCVVKLNEFPSKMIDIFGLSSEISDLFALVYLLIETFSSTKSSHLLSLLVKSSEN